MKLKLNFQLKLPSSSAKSTPRQPTPTTPHATRWYASNVKAPHIATFMRNRTAAAALLSLQHAPPTKAPSPTGPTLPHRARAVHRFPLGLRPRATDTSYAAAFTHTLPATALALPTDPHLCCRLSLPLFLLPYDFDKCHHACRSRTSDFLTMRHTLGTQWLVPDPNPDPKRL